MVERKGGGSFRFSLKSILAVASVILVLLSLKSINDSNPMIQMKSVTTAEKAFTKNVSIYDAHIAKISLAPSSAPTKRTRDPTSRPTRKPSFAPTTPPTMTLNATDPIRSIRNAIKMKQIENYRIGEALLLNFHPTHHGGTSFCDAIGMRGGPVASPQFPDNYPRFACLGDSQHLVNDTEFDFSGGNMRYTPVEYNRTGDYVKALRPHFHMTSWEYNSVEQMRRKLSITNWEHPKLLSVVITRDPISRLLAGDGMLLNKYKGYNDGTLSHAGWWDLATNRRETDNFFLRMMEGTRRKRRKAFQGENGFIYSDDNLPTIDSLRPYFDMDESHYREAVAVLDRFTIVLDIACLSESMRALVDVLGLDSTAVEARLARMKRIRANSGKHKTRSAQERIGYDDVYKYLLEKHEWDIKLYEYSKTISLVDCEQVARNK